MYLLKQYTRIKAVAITATAEITPRAPPTTGPIGTEEDAVTYMRGS